ncbi:MAG: hypothetical protein GIW94_12340 [Candidatus Eremiobacteraeota bacterium]|nr:hypothetical protein [Candidatus Eremiobacteraeota bacterium]MBC5824874.1 hypothetical protein [Candidatus Eremiobacteraeota bacterium]
MENDTGDVVFLVRIRRRDVSRPWEWRGSVHEVATGRRFYVSSGRDVADFIDLRLSGLAPEEP